MGDRIRPLAALLLLAAALCVTPAAPAVGSRPRIGARIPSGATSAAGWASSNWSGYAVSGGPFTSITGEWDVPAVSPTKRATYSSNWIGIDGFNNSSLIQTGTEQDYYNRSSHYYAWWEILPAAETVITTMTVKPGDHMSASIKQSQGSSWTITLTDVTTGQSFTSSKTYTGPLTSAEWIEEAPTVGGHVAPLAHYGSSVFDPGTVNGGSPSFVPSEGGVMIQSNTQVSTPSLPDADVDGFRVTYGSAVPSAPGS
jgi:hypothetical protein